MRKRMTFAAIAIALFCFISMVVDRAQPGKRNGDAVFVVVVVVLLLAGQVYSVAKMKPAKDASELGDDDGGIDWREENVGGEMVQMWNGWAVLLDEVPVHEAKAAAEKLEAAQMRCRLELLQEDRSYHRFGNGGMGTLMCVLVAPSDYAAAKKLLMGHDGI